MRPNMFYSALVSISKRVKDSPGFKPAVIFQNEEKTVFKIFICQSRKNKINDLLLVLKQKSTIPRRKWMRFEEYNYR